MPLVRTFSVATAINNVGQIAGYSDFGGVPSATLWSNGTVTDLGEGRAFAINDAGQVVGSSDIGGISTATLWSGGTVTDLGNSAKGSLQYPPGNQRCGTGGGIY